MAHRTLCGFECLTCLYLCGGQRESHGLTHLGQSPFHHRDAGFDDTPSAPEVWETAKRDRREKSPFGRLKHHAKPAGEGKDGRMRSYSLAKKFHLQHPRRQIPRHRAASPFPRESQNLRVSETVRPDLIPEMS